MVGNRAVERPIGVSILATLTLLEAALSLLMAIGLMAGAGALAALFSPDVIRAGATPENARYLGVGLQVLGGFFLLLALFQFLIGWGYWTLRRWAWWWGVITTGLALLSDLGSLGQGQTGAGSIVSLLLSLAILWYLFRPEVRQAFGRG